MGLGEQKSTTTAIQSFIEGIQEAMDNGLQAIAIFFLFTKGICCIKPQGTAG